MQAEAAGKGLNYGLATRNRIRVTVKCSDMSVCYIQEMRAVAAIPKGCVNQHFARLRSQRCGDLIQHHRDV